MNDESQALQIAANDKINELSRQLHPEGSWRWIWHERRTRAEEEGEGVEEQDEELREIPEVQWEDLAMKMSELVKGWKTSDREVSCYVSLSLRRLV